MVQDRDVLLQVTNSRWYSTYLIAAIVMTLSVLEGYFPIISHFKCDFSYFCGTSRGPSVSAELFVVITRKWAVSWSGIRQSWLPTVEILTVSITRWLEQADWSVCW